MISLLSPGHCLPSSENDLPFKNSEFGTLGTLVFLQFLFTWNNQVFSVITFPLDFLPHTQTGNSLGQIQGSSFSLKNILYDTVFQRMEVWNTPLPASVIQKIDHISKGIFQYIQFPVQFDSNRLKGSFGRVSAYGTDFHRNRCFYHLN